MIEENIVKIVVYVVLFLATVLAIGKYDFEKKNKV